MSTLKKLWRNPKAKRRQPESAAEETPTEEG